MKKITVAVDGPAGAGKSTIARAVAEMLGILYIDTGAMYRAVTLKVIRDNIDVNNIIFIKNILDNINIVLKGDRVFLDGEDVSKEIRGQDVNNLVSKVAAEPIVREKLVELQRDIARNTSVIMDGRDIGTNVLKDADIKIYLTAEVEERARRRFHELENKGYDVDFESIKNDIVKRDEIDSRREKDPLRAADDAITVDTTGKSIKNVTDEIFDIIKKRWDDVL